MDLKVISHAAIPRALALAERYRLLNEPEQAESICKDILETEPNSQVALRTLLLAITDQFGKNRAATIQHAEDCAEQLQSDYEKLYFKGVACERWARCKLEQRQAENLVHDWLNRAMSAFEKAEAVRPEDDDSALLRWNSCLRLSRQLPTREEAIHHPDYGD